MENNYSTEKLIEDAKNYMFYRLTYHAGFKSERAFWDAMNQIAEMVFRIVWNKDHEAADAFFKWFVGDYCLEVVNVEDWG